MKLLLLSGGLDSSALLASRDDIGGCLFVDYGQAHFNSEFQAATHLACRHGKWLAKAQTMIPGEPEPHTFNLPGRNTILATLGAAAAKASGLDALIMGISADDYACYPDCRQEWVDAMNEVLRFSGLPPLEAPFANSTKADILNIAKESGLDIGATTSCYNGNECGECGACEVRAKCLR